MSANTKDTTCIRCLGKLVAYAGRPVGQGTRYCHHAGQCVTCGELESDARKLAGQTSMFAASCTRLDEAARYDIGALCSFATTDREAAAEHFRTEHGAKSLRMDKLIRLRKAPPAAKFPPVELTTTKRIYWTHRTYSEWRPEVGQECTETSMRGQFWSDGPHPHSVYVIPDPVAGRPQPPVTLYLDSIGGAHENWSDAKRIRSEASRGKKHARAA